MSTFIEARVIQKVDTEANWMANPLKLYQGEVAYVSDKYNFKLNTTDIPKTFAELEYYYKGDVISGVLPTDYLANKPDGVYRATISGTYGGVVTKEGYSTLLRKTGSVWSLEQEVKMPMQDLTPLENRITENENKVDEFIRDFSVTTDTEFNAESKNPIANSAVTKLYSSLKSYIDEIEDGDLLEDGVKKDINQLDTILKSFLAKGEFLEIPTNDSQFGYIKNDNSIVNEPENKYITLTNIQDYEGIYFNGYKALSSAWNVNNFSTILAILDDNSTVSLLNMHPSNSVQTVQEFTINLPNRVKSLKVGWSVYEMPVTTVPEIRLLKGNGFKEDYVKKYIDERFVVLDSFLNPTEEIIEEIEMPQTGEITGAGVNDGWRQYAADGLFNGAIPISEFDGFDRIKLTGLTTALDGIMYLAGYNNATNIYDILLVSRDVTGDFEIEIDNRYEAYLYSRNSSTQFFKIKILKEEIEKDSVLKAIESGVGTGSKISQQTKAEIDYPTNLIELNFETSDNLPTTKETIAKGILNYTDNAGTSFKKFATLKVQGSSSAGHPKKNWTFALFNKEDYSDDFKLRIGNWAYHSEFVFKSNWIDATHTRNILSNKIWEDIVQSRKYFPKRENEVAYLASNTNVDQRFDSGALCHVDGVPAKLFVNGNFYGIGTFNIGKKRENYDLKSSNQNHIQLAAETHANFYSYIPEQWEIRNPKTPDANFLTKINAWFASNALTGQSFKDNFEINHDLKNAIDFFLLAEFIQSPDMYTKNLIVTSWDGVKFYFLPYDMDTTFGLQWDGLSFTGHTTSIRIAAFWQKFYTSYTSEIKARYKVLRDSGVFTLENVYKHADKMNKTFGVENFKQEFEAWTQVPSNSTIYTSYPQIYQWVKDRLIWLDSQYL